MKYKSISCKGLLKLGTSELGNMGLNPNLDRDRVESWLNNMVPILAGDHTVNRQL